MSKKKILILDGFSTIHVGNGALIDNSIDVIKECFPDADIKMLTKDIQTNLIKYPEDMLLPSYYTNFWDGKNRVSAIMWILRNVLEAFILIINQFSFNIKPEKIVLSKRKKLVLKHIEKADVTVSIFGEVMKDVFRYRMYFWLFLFWLAQKRGSKMVIFPQSIGPFSIDISKKMMKWALKDAKIIAARDQDSVKVLKELFPGNTNIVFSPDVAFRQRPLKDISLEKYFPDNTKEIIGVTISKLIKDETGKKGDYFNYIINAIKDIADPKTYKILIMPSNYKTNGQISADYEESLKAKEKLSELFDVAILENRPYFPDEYQTIQQKLKVLITTRMHVGIMATTTFIPVISINTQYKIRGYMQNIGIEEYCIDLDELSKLPELLSKTLQNTNSIKKTLSVSIPLMRSQQSEFITLFKNL
jgi:polysaccharide pyruvyl transferase WcaK-like protein